MLTKIMLSMLKYPTNYGFHESFLQKMTKIKWRKKYSVRTCPKSKRNRKNRGKSIHV